MNNFAQAASFFGQLAAGAYANNLSPVLDMIGAAVKAEVENEIGEYQSGIGGFPATAPLAASTLERKSKHGLGKHGNPDSPLWATGKFHDSIGTRKSIPTLSVQIGSNEDHVIFHELGTSNEPPRPVFGPATLRVLPRLIPAISAAAAHGIAGGVWQGLSAEGITHTSQGQGVRITT